MTRCLQDIYKRIASIPYYWYFWVKRKALIGKTSSYERWRTRRRERVKEMKEMPKRESFSLIQFKVCMILWSLWECCESQLNQSWVRVSAKATTWQAFCMNFRTFHLPYPLNQKVSGPYTTVQAVNTTYKYEDLVGE